MQRVYFAAQQRRRRLGRRLVVGGLVLGVAMATGAALGLSGISRALVAYVAVLSPLLLAVGLRLATDRRSFVDVDGLARTATFTVDGSRQAPVPLDSLAPLTVTPRTPFVDHQPRQRHDSALRVHPAGRPDYVLAEVETADAARRELRTLARAWALASQDLAGPVVAPTDLGRPLRERLAKDWDARRPVPLNPSWGLAIATTSSGHTVRSTRGSWGSGVLYLPMILPIVFAIVQLDLAPAFRDPAADPAATIVLGVLCLMAAGFVAKALPALRERVLPGALHIGASGVSFRGRHLALDEIEDVLLGASIDIVGPRRSLRLPAGFAPAESLVLLRHEIQRLILAVG